MEQNVKGRGPGRLLKRTWIPNMGLRFKLASIVVLGFIVSFCVVLAAIATSQTRQNSEFARETSKALTDQLSQQMGASLKFQRAERLRQIYESMTENEEIRLQSIVVTDAAGKPVDQLSDVEGEDLGWLTEAAQTSLKTGEPVIFGRDGGVVVAEPVAVGNGADVVGAVAILWNFDKQRKMVVEAYTTALIMACAAMGLGLFAIMVAISKMVSNPLLRLTNVVEQIAGGDYASEIPDRSRRDEIGRISGHLGAFRDRLSQEELAQAERQESEKRKSTLFDHLSDCIGQVSGGDLTPRVDIGYADGLDESYRKVCNDLNELIENFSDVMLTVVGTAESVRASATEISQVADAQSQRSEAQASTLEESAAALDELTNSVKSAAEHAAEADNAVAENRRQAEASGEIVRNAIAAMQQIEESSSQITQIIGVIDDIAFQTNLLALNAGVEAARAGESGRGFAVVASEVRALAQRASESAREIKDLISKSGQQVNEGGMLVSETGDALAEIINRIRKVSELVSNIAASMREQSTGLEEINSGINELDKVTQQNAAVIEETSAASQALSKEAERLSSTLDRFRVAGRDGEVTRAVAAPKPPATGTFGASATPSAATATDTSGWQDY